MDEAGSKAHIAAAIAPKIIEELETQIKEEATLKLDAVNEQNFEMAAKHRDCEKDLRAQLSDVYDKWEESIKTRKGFVDAKAIEEVVSMMSGIPVQKIAEEENQKLLNMGDVLKQCIIGQDDAINKVVKAIRRNRVGLKDPQKPIGTFMFL